MRTVIYGSDGDAGFCIVPKQIHQIICMIYSQKDRPIGRQTGPLTTYITNKVTCQYGVDASPHAVQTPADTTPRPPNPLTERACSTNGQQCKLVPVYAGGDST